MKKIFRFSYSTVVVFLLLSGCAHQSTSKSSTDEQTVLRNLKPSSPDTTQQPAEVLHEDNAYSHYRLANGFELIVKQDKRAPIVHHMSWLRVGSIDEVDGSSGLAHMLEHMMFLGSKKLKPNEFSTRIANLGGSENAMTSNDFTAYFQKIGSQHLATVMELESERFEHSQWSDKQFLRERSVVQEERRMRVDDQPFSAFQEHLFATAFLAAPQRRPIIGWMEDIKKYTPNDAREFFKKWYVPANAAVVVVGNVVPQEVLRIAQNTYGKIPARKVPERKISDEPAQLGPRWFHVHSRVEQPSVAIAYKVPVLKNILQPSASDREALALLMLSQVLGGHEGARLNRNLTQGDNPIAQNVSSSYKEKKRGDLTFFALSGTPINSQDLMKLEQKLRDEVTNIALHGISQKELNRLITMLTAASVYKRDSSHKQANELGENWIVGWPLNANEILIKQLRTITIEEMQAVVRKYFSDQQMTVGYLLPIKADTPTKGQVKTSPFRSIK